ncbi:MAG: O-antigen ligase [Methylomicrobium sp.]
MKAADSKSHALSNWISHQGWLLLAAFVVVLPFGNAFEAPIAIMAALGLWLVYSQRQAVVAAPFFRPMMLVGLGFWLPMLLSLPDAVNFSRALETSLAFLRLPLVVVFAGFALANDLSRQRLLQAIGWTLSVFSVCVIVAVVFQIESGLLTTIGKQRAVGHKLAIFSIVYGYWLIREVSTRRWMAMWLPIFIAAVFFSGARVAWIMLATSIGLLLVWLVVVEKKRWRLRSIAAAGLLALVALGALIQHPAIYNRLEEATYLFSDDYEKANKASSLRLPIWHVGALVAQDHWLNGIGPRGFRYVYADYAPPDDFWVHEEKVIPAHPHLMLLEIASETGSIGLAGYLLVLVYWLRLLGRQAKARESEGWLWMSAVLVAIMPYNAHMAFYASFWSCITWWLLAVALAFLRNPTISK